MYPGRAGRRQRARTAGGGGRTVRLTPELVRQAEAMLRDRGNHPFIRDVIRALPDGRSAFHARFPKERIRNLRG